MKSKILNSIFTLSLVTFLLPAIHSFSQSTQVPGNGIKPPVVPCLSDEMKQLEVAQKPGIQASFDAAENQIQAWVNNHPHAVKSAPKTNNGQPPLIVIPVVFHILYHTAAQNISNAQCMTQIARWNLDYRKDNADTGSVRALFKPIAGDPQIEFCIAQRTANNQSTNGFIHKYTDTVTFHNPTVNMKFSATGGDDAWNKDQFLNVWVVNMDGGVLGFATFPGGTPAFDGVVIQYDALGQGGTAASPCNLGRTGTHEVGHWLGLYHPFQGGCTGMTATTCATQGDNCCDTPPVASANFNCPVIVNSCSETYLGNRPDITEDYMDYTNDACKYLFTLDQIARMHGTINTTRAALKNSFGCLPPGLPPVCNFTSSANTICVGQTVTFTDATTVSTPSSFNWNFGSGAVPSSSNATGPHTITFTSPGSIVVTYSVTNGNGNSIHKDTIIVKAIPNPNITGIPIVCSNSTNTYTITASTSSYQWNVTGGSIASGQGSNTIAVNWATPQNAIIYITETSTNGCVGNDSLIVQVQSTINPVITGSISACVGLQKNYSLPVIAGSTYAWSVTNGSIASGQGTANVAVTWGASGNGSVGVTQTYYAGCTGTDTLNNVIYPIPNPTISGTTNICAGGNLTFTVPSTNNSTYNWLLSCSGCSIANGQGTNSVTVQFNNAGNNSLQVLQNSNGCPGGSNALAINVYPKPTPTFTTAQTGLTIQFTNTTVGGVTASWNFGDTQSANTLSPAHTYASAGSYTVTLTVTDANNCTNTASQDITVGGIGINKLNQQANLVEITPNPSSDLLQLKITNATLQPLTITFTDVVGRVVKVLQESSSKTTTTLINTSIAELSNGTYFVKVEGLESPVVKKIIKK